MKTKLFIKLIPILVLGMISFGCMDDGNETSPPSTETASESLKIENLTPCGTPTVVEFYAGQHIDIGTITVQNDEDNLYVTYSLTGDWTLDETHLYVGPCDEIPLNGGGNPIIGHFPYSASHNGIQEYTYTIPLSTFDENCFCVVAHAAVSNGTQTETAFGYGTEFPGNRWGWYFEYCIEPCEGCTDCPDSCETAFAYGDQCFITDPDYNFNRWGWVSGPINVDDINNLGDIPIYAGAGQCDISKGTLVGTLSLNYDANSGELTVVYNMDSPYTMSETHFYVGNEKYPTLPNGNPTVAPGHYGNSHSLSDVTSDTFVIDNVSGDIYFIAHAVVCSL